MHFMMTSTVCILEASETMRTALFGLFLYWGLGDTPVSSANQKRPFCYAFKQDVDKHKPVLTQQLTYYRMFHNIAVDT